MRAVKRDGYEFLLMEVWRQEWKAENADIVEVMASDSSKSPISNSTNAAQSDTELVQDA